MADTALPKDSLVLYKLRPARVTRTGDRLMIEMAGGEQQKVRPKDVTLLHPGPLHDLHELKPQVGEVQAAWEILAAESGDESTTTLAELAELIYGTYTPATAWATWELIADGLYFRGATEAVRACTPEEIAKVRAARAVEAAERQAWKAFLGRVRAGRVAPEDERYLKDVEALALGQSTRSQVLRKLGREESFENAHATLLEFGYWDEMVNPYPRRLGLPNSAPAISLPELPAEARRDLTHLPAFAIDDAGSDTPDDALSLEGDRLWVHVADAAALVSPGSAADLEARARGATSYLPEGTVPMLPPEATPVLGLGLAEVSPALSFGIDLDPDGQVARLEITPSWVRVTRLTYDEAELHLAEEPFQSLYQLAKAYQARRNEHGAVVLNFPEVKVSVVGRDVILRPLPPLRSRALVEGAMIMTGEASARFAIEHGIPLPYATQEPSETAERPESLSEMFAFRRTLKRSQYRSVPAPHGGLGLPAYVQATSPLRRYLDLVVHQQLRAYLRGEQLLDAGEVLERVGATEAIVGTLRRAEQLSRRHWTLVYLLRRPDWRGKGVLVDKRGRSGKVLIPELGLEVQVYVPGDPPLDSTLPLALKEVDLARLDARFRVGN